MRCLLSALIIMACLASIGCGGAPRVNADPVKEPPSADSLFSKPQILAWLLESTDARSPFREYKFEQTPLDTIDMLLTVASADLDDVRKAAAIFLQASSSNRDRVGREDLLEMLLGLMVDYPERQVHLTYDILVNRDGKLTSERDWPDDRMGSWRERDFQKDLAEGIRLHGRRDLTMFIANRETDGDAMVFVGAIDPNRSGHVANLLERHGIEALIEGSVAYYVAVPKDDVQQARQLLRNDSQKEGYWFQEKALVLSESLLTFDECPSPSALENPETRSAATTEYKKCMRKLNDLNSRDLRLLVVEIQNRRSQLLNSGQSNYNDSKQYVDDGDKLFLLNRFVFDVPINAADGSPAFWRLTAYHSSPGSVNYLYPLSSEGGRLVFSAETLSYSGTGPGGDQLDECDYFAKKFARRNEIR